MIRLLFLAFAFSGAAGLIYEAIWGRYLALFVGHSAYAQVLVIAAFLGGMAVGALGVGEAAKKLKAPLLWYAGAEGLLALMGFLFHLLFQGFTGLAYASLFPALGGTVWVEVVKWGLALALILPQAVLLGTTFPLLSSGMLRGTSLAPGRTLSLLYFTNSLGASVGVLVAGFALVAWVGLPGSLAVAAFLNLAAGGIAAGVHRARSPVPGPGVGIPASPLKGRRGAPLPVSVAGMPETLLWRLLLSVAFFTAVASFIYEIGWIRMLSLVMGSATHSFELMLSAFILGLALGALFVRRLADGAVPPLPLLGWVQWIMGAAALATLPVYASSFGFMAFLVEVLPADGQGYLLFSLARYGIAMAVMLPSAVMAGMTLPLITATLLRAGLGERSIGWVYGVNTLGSVTGVIFAGLVALPWLGLKGMIVAGALLDMGLGVLLLAFRVKAKVPGAGWAVAGTLAGAILLAGGVQMALDLDKRVLTSGVYRHGLVPTEEDEPILFYKDGRTASVSVHRASPPEMVVLSTNGKPDASISMRWIRAQTGPMPAAPIVVHDEATQSLISLLAMAFRPEGRTVAHIGHGSGLTGELLLASPRLERSVTIEIEPEMIRASEAFYPANARTFEDPRSTFVIDDAKSYFASGARRFDLIVSEPSNPWVSGTASLFTQEFYRQIRNYLEPGGILVQWIQAYEMSDELVSSVLAALHRAFPDYRGYMVGPGDLAIVASATGPLPDPDWSVFQLPGVERILAHVPEFGRRRLNGLEIFDRRVLTPVLEAWEPVNSDFHPHLDLGAERARFEGRGAFGYVALSDRRTSLTSLFRDVPRGFGTGWERPVLEMRPFRALSVSSWLRWARYQETGVEEAPTDHHRGAFEEYLRYSLQVNRPAPPRNWRSFMERTAWVERSLHAGTSGVADSLFYGRLFRYLRQTDAPLEARAVGDFLYGVAAWDHQRASRAAAILVDALARGEEWVPGEMLLEGGVLARLALADGEGAREIMDRVGNPWRENPRDLRWELLKAWTRRGSLFAPPGADSVPSRR